jgi:P-aminobenzoate N-oxygenase AurF
MDTTTDMETREPRGASTTSDTKPSTKPSTPPGPSLRAVDQRIERLSTASLKRIVEPDADVPGNVGDGQVLPDELLSLANVPELFDALTDEQKRVLAREEFASIVDTGVRFESVLMAGFSLDILSRPDLTDPRVTYLLHEMGEETRHSRLFVRLLEQVKPQAKNPLDRPIGRLAMKIAMPFLTAMPSLFCLLVLSGEEVPDLLQKLASEHPDTDPMIKAVSKYHRQEEARHLAFGRMLFPEQWAAAGPVERFLVRHLGSRIAKAMFDTIVHPGVYGTVGLPTWSTWKAVNRSAGRTAMRHRALRPLLTPLLEAGVFRGGRVPKGWRIACGVDRVGAASDPVAAV